MGLLHDIEDRICRVESDLRLRPVLEAEPVSVSLADRMRFLYVPGVSIAVMNGGQIEWARAFASFRNGCSETPEYAVEPAIAENALCCRPL